jgi:serine/threonine-protein kinase
MADVLDRTREGLVRYRVERELAQGGMGTVVLATDTATEQRVAIKVLSPWVADQITQERFLREIAFISRLTFEHILPILDSGEVDGLLYYVMPFLEGRSLRDRLIEEHIVPIDDALRIMQDVGEALSWAHVHNIIHRDVKPENIFLSMGRAVVMDFGVAVAISASLDERLTRPGEVLGTPLYMSPEQAMGRRRIDHRTDIYALGCVLYEMLSGVPPFQPANPRALIVRRFNQDAPSVRELDPQLPEYVDEAIRRSLAWLPEDRFDTVAQFMSALDIARPMSPSRSGE